MLSIGNLHEEILERQHRRNQVFEDVLEKVISRVKYVNSISDDCYVIYTLNNFIYGIPTFNINKCGNYLQTRLAEAGFYAQYNQKNLLYISWKSRPKQDKILETHQIYIPKLNKSSITEQNLIGYNDSITSYHTQYPNYKNSNKTDPNMLLLKNNNNPQKSKQLSFQELDKQFLNSNQLIPSNQNYNNIQNYNNNQSNNMKYNNNINNNIKSNIKTFTINKSTNKTIPKTIQQSSNNLDDFLGTLM